MSRFERLDTQVQSSGIHPHFHENYGFSRKFCENCEGKMPQGIMVKIVDSGSQSSSINACLLMISWNPPRCEKEGNWANPIFMHQDKITFRMEVKWSFNQLMNMHKKFKDRQPKLVQQELFND